MERDCRSTQEDDDCEMCTHLFVLIATVTVIVFHAVVFGVYLATHYSCKRLQ